MSVENNIRFPLTNGNLQTLKVILQENDDNLLIALRFKNFKGVEIIDLLKSEVEKIYTSYSENYTFDFFIDEFILFSKQKNQKMNQIFNLFVKNYEKKKKK